MSLRDAAQQALEALEEYQTKGAPFWACDAAVAALRAALAEPQPEPVALTFAGLTVRELRIPAKMTVRIDGDTLTVAPQRDPNDPLIVEPNHDPSHAPYVALAEPQPQSTHSTDCYKWHHKCAIAEVERLRAHGIGGDK